MLHGKRLSRGPSTLSGLFPSNAPFREGPYGRRVCRILRYAARSLRRQPAFALLAVGTLALGIGANAAIFSVVNAVLLKPLAYSQPERIVAINNLWRKSGASGSVSAPGFPRLARHRRVFARCLLTHYDRGADQRARRAGVADYGSTSFCVTPELLPTCSASARSWARRSSRRDESGSAVTAVIGHDFWMRRFGGRPECGGRTVDFAGRAFTIVGVMPSGVPFSGAQRHLVLRPGCSPRRRRAGAHNYRGRGAAEGSGRHARAGASELIGRGGRLERRVSRCRTTARARSSSRCSEQLVGDTRPTLNLLARRCGAGAADRVRQRSPTCCSRARPAESE